jgi:hypothetical protein
MREKINRRHPHLKSLDFEPHALHEVGIKAINPLKIDYRAEAAICPLKIIF